MKVHIPPPRLLPTTIAVLAALVSVKAVWLVRGWLPGPVAGGMIIVAAAKAAEHEKSHGGAAAPAPKHGAPAAATPKPAAAEPAPEPPAPAGPPPFSESERAVLLELRQRRQELEARAATVTARESMLTAAEQKIAARVEELQTLQKRLETLDAGRQQREEASWQGLVKLYETMKPREAATIFNDLTMSVLLPLIGHMKEAKAAPILAAMSPDKARDVTAQIARTRSRLEPPPETRSENPMPANTSRPSTNKS